MNSTLQRRNDVHKITPKLRVNATNNITKRELVAYTKIV